MNKYLILLCMSCSLFMSGCATSLWEARYGHEKPHISYIKTPSGELQDRLYVWNPNHNAAYVFQDDSKALSACLASADVAKSRNVEHKLDIDVGKIVDKIDSANIENSLKIIENITKLSEKKEAASFLNVAMFHICMLAGAKTIDSKQANELMLEAIRSAIKLKPALSLPAKPPQQNEQG